MSWQNLVSRPFQRQGRRFPDRATAGRALAAELAGYSSDPDVVVLALPRGGVPVASEVARALDAPLDLVLVRKLGVPGQEELAMGAIAEGGALILNDDVVGALQIRPDELSRTAAIERQELDRRARLYRRGRAPLDLGDRTVILIDDGLATGATMRAAIAAVRAQRPARIVVAVPVAARETVDELRRQVDDLVAVEEPEWLGAIGLWYVDFAQTSDEEVIALLHAAPRPRHEAREQQ